MMMLSMFFGLGAAEMVIVLLAGLLLVGGSAAIMLVVVLAVGRGDRQRLAQLEAENRHLREELD